MNINTRLTEKASGKDLSDVVDNYKIFLNQGTVQTYSNALTMEKKIDVPMDPIAETSMESTRTSKIEVSLSG